MSGDPEDIAWSPTKPVEVAAFSNAETRIVQLFFPEPMNAMYMSWEQARLIAHQLLEMTEEEH